LDKSILNSLLWAATNLTILSGKEAVQNASKGKIILTCCWCRFVTLDHHQIDIGCA
jgi:hypothetical protein